MKKFNLILFCLFIPFLLGSNANKETFQIVKENGIPVAVNPDFPIPAENSPTGIVFEEELTLGSAKGDQQTMFGDIIRYTADDEGNIYVLDWRAYAVKKFGPDGNFLLSFGRAGQGPGEFSSPSEIRLLSNGYLIIFEGESQRFSVFNQDGDFIKSGRFSKLMSSPYFGFANGNFIATHIQYGEEKTMITTGLFSDKSEFSIPFYQKESDPLQPWPRNDPDARARRFGEVMSRNAFTPTEVIALDRKETIYFAFSDRYEIQIFSSKGKLERKIRSALPFRPVTKMDQENFLNIWVPKDISTWGTMDEGMKKKIKNLIRFPSNKPAFLEILPMSNGYLLVLRDGFYGENALVDIFDSQGRFVIEKELPFPIQDGLSRGEKLYTIVEDEDGFQFVRRYDVQFVYKN